VLHPHRRLRCGAQFAQHVPRAADSVAANRTSGAHATAVAQHAHTTPPQHCSFLQLHACGLPLRVRVLVSPVSRCQQSTPRCASPTRHCCVATAATGRRGAARTPRDGDFWLIQVGLCTQCGCNIWRKAFLLGLHARLGCPVLRTILFYILFYWYLTPSSASSSPPLPPTATNSQHRDPNSLQLPLPTATTN